MNEVPKVRAAAGTEPEGQLVFSWCRLTSEPATVVDTGGTATPLRRSNLHRVGGSSDSHDGDTKAEDEAADNELVV